MARKDPDKYIGRWRETEFAQLSLPWGKASLRKLLRDGSDPQPHYTHQQIADWCGRYYFAVSEGELGEDPSADIVEAADIALDVDAQWDLYLIDTHTLAELQSMDFSSVRLPAEWFAEWLSKLGSRAV